MDVEINVWGVLLAAVSSMAVGAFWYARSVFGNTWMKLAKVDAKKAEKMSVNAMVIAFVLSLVTAYVLAHVTYLSFSFFAASYMSAALTTAFWLWLGLTAARMTTHDAFEGRPMKLTALNAGNELATLLVMGLFIGWVGL